MISNPAFALIRKYKDVPNEVESLVVKKTRGRLTMEEMITAFENGISGQYGKFYSADPQTLIGWVEKFLSSKNSSANYLDGGLLPLAFPSYESHEWDKEANKCYTAFLNGVSETHFHRCVYDRMMIDGKIQINAYLKHFTDTGNEAQDVLSAKQKVLRDVFLQYKSKSWTSVYLIPPKS